MSPYESVKAQIEKDISENNIMVYMKGTPEQPQCGFSAQVVQIFNHFGASFASRDVLQDEELRQGIKEFSEWPTIPQAYVKGEFIGGCDILTEMAENGELEKILKQAELKSS